MISNTFSRIIPSATSFTEYINSRVQLDSTLTLLVEDSLKKEDFKKNHLLLKEGVVAHRIFFLEKGSARTFYFHDGKDITSWIYRQGHLLTSWSSFYTRTPSYENVELTEDSTIVSLSYDQLQNLYSQHPGLQKFGRIMVEEQLVYLDYFYKGFMFMTAKEKYDLLLSIFPDVTLRVNLGHIASFLGISQETLSRIRKKK